EAARQNVEHIRIEPQRDNQNGDTGHSEQGHATPNQRTLLRYGVGDEIADAHGACIAAGSNTVQSMGKLTAWRIAYTLSRLTSILLGVSRQARSPPAESRRMPDFRFSPQSRNRNVSSLATYRRIF